jgi:hypothetical protein
MQLADCHCFWKRPRGVLVLVVRLVDVDAMEDDLCADAVRLTSCENLVVLTMQEGKMLNLILKGNENLVVSFIICLALLWLLVTKDTKEAAFSSHYFTENGRCFEDYSIWKARK